MEQNVGSTDSYLRFILGAAFWVNIFALGTGIAGTIVLFLLGALMFYTADKHYCFLYKVLNVATVGGKAEETTQDTPAEGH